MRWRPWHHGSVTVALLSTLCVSLALAAPVGQTERQAERGRHEEARERWQNVPAVFEALGVAEGRTIADIGAGGGFFTVRLARAVGPTGRAIAVDISERALERLRARIEAEGLTNVTVVQGAPDDPRLEPASVDSVLIVNAYHEMDQYEAILSHIRRALRPDGRLVIVEPISERRREATREAQVRDHEIAPEHVVREVRTAGFRIVALQDPLVERGNSRSVEWMLVAAPAGDTDAARGDARSDDAARETPRGDSRPTPAQSPTSPEAAPDDWRSPSLRIGVDEFTRLLADNAVVVLDVRDQYSYAEGHLPGAILVPPEEIENRIDELRAFGKPIVTYCS